MLCLSDCSLSIETARQLLAHVRPEHHDLFYIDLQGNQLGNELLDLFAEVLARYDLLEFIGAGNNGLNSLVRASQQEKVSRLLEGVGRREVDAEFVAKYNERVRERGLIIEKNKKLRTLKKPEDYVFPMDTLAYSDEAKSHVMYHKERLRFVNLQENFFPVAVFDTLKACYMRAPNIGFSMEGNRLPFDNLQTLKNLYGHRIVL